MLGQRLSQLEDEARHKQEIADLRTEQVRMLSQLMLLSAGQQQMAPAGAGPTRTNEEFVKQQQERLCSQCVNPSSFSKCTGCECPPRRKV